MSFFWKTAIKNFLQIGAVLPSTRFVCRSVCKRFPPHTKVVVEYGPGTGVLTREVLRRLPADSKIYSIELNETFIQALKEISDPRFQLTPGDVVDYARRLGTLDPRGVDVVVSGIPFSFLQDEVTEEIVRNTSRGLKEGGVFIVYQYSLTMVAVLKRHFPSVGISIELRNIPPTFIMTASKTKN